MSAIIERIRSVLREPTPDVPGPASGHADSSSKNALSPKDWQVFCEDIRRYVSEGNK